MKRNQSRFPKEFCFHLNLDEIVFLRFQNGTSSNYGGRRYLPYAYTEQGVAMLAGVLHSDIAVQTSISIMNAFVSMRHYLADNAGVFQRLNTVETHLVEHDDKISYLFKQLEQPKPNSVNIFFKGQMWDALICIETIIKRAKESIVLIDGYVDETTLEILSKKKNKIPVTIITYKQNCKITDKEIEDFSAQYGKLTVRYSNEFHDRFLILDKKELYHIGASIKDAGKKGFAVFEDVEKDVLELLLKKL